MATFAILKPRLHLLAAAFACTLIAAPGAAMDLERLSAMCRDAALERPTALGSAVAERALGEHRTFGGHVIDARGRLLRIGSHETATTGEFGVERGQVPWRKVLGYWESLSGRLAAESQAATPQAVAYHSAILSAQEGEPAHRRSLPLQTLLSAIAAADFSREGTDAESVRQALAASVIRASNVDVPWSAAFVSAVLKDAGVKPEQFAFSAAHVTYIGQAVRTAASESLSTPVDALYRACDPYGTVPRRGDLLCYHRHRLADAPAAGPDLFGWLVKRIAEGDSPISRSHCDIVIGVDVHARKVRVVGGNVQQSVALRSLNLNRRMVLSTNQGLPSCGEGSLTGTPPGPCSLNAQPWFVLLQMRRH
jgi:hypothetical protein